VDIQLWTGFFDCSDGVSRRTLSGGAWHSDPDCIFSRLPATAGDSVRTSRWVLVPSCCHITQPHLSVYRNVRVNLFRETACSSYFAYCVPVACFVLLYDFVVVTKLFFPWPVHDVPSWISWCLSHVELYQVLRPQVQVLSLQVRVQVQVPTS